MLTAASSHQHYQPSSSSSSSPRISFLLIVDFAMCHSLGQALSLSTNRPEPTTTEYIISSLTTPHSLSQLYQCQFFSLFFKLDSATQRDEDHQRKERHGPRCDWTVQRRDEINSRLCRQWRYFKKSIVKVLHQQLGHFTSWGRFRS